MTSVPVGRTLALSLLTASALTAPVRAQDPCPSASGADAEAGWAAYVANDIEGARRYFEAALARCDNDQYSRTGLGYVDLRDGNEADAERLWTAVVAAEPTNVDALVGLGLARWRAGDIDAVRERFTLVLQLSPDHPTAVDYLERLSGAEDPAGTNDPADEAWTSGNTTLAMRLYDERLASDPEDRTAMLRVALMHAWQEEYGVAIDLLDRLIEIQPGHLDARLARARVRAWSGDIVAAQQEVAEVLAEQPDNPEALEALALFQTWAGEYEEALDSYEELLSIAPGNRGAQRQQARALASASRFEASRAAYDALLERDPDDIEARLGLARTLSISQDFDGALQQYDEVLTRAPGDMRALTGKAKALGWAGRLVESERVARQAVEVDGSSVEAWGGLGQVYRWQGRTAAAKEALERAAALAPTNAEVRDQLRSVDFSLAPLARPSVVYERDSDSNRMVTTKLVAGWHPMPRLDVRAEGSYRQVEQTFALGVLERTAQTAVVSGTYQISPGWRLSAGLGGSVTDAPDDPAFLAYRAGVRTPERHTLGAALDVSGGGLHETAALVEREITSTDVILTGRWSAGPDWRVDGNVAWAVLEGTQDNHRRGGYVAASRRIGPRFSLGASFRAFTFEKNLDEGYFDPDFYGIWEVTSYWLHRAAPWTFLIELAPGVEKVTTDGDLGGSLRSNARVAYRLGPGREVSLSFGHSTAGLTSFATSASGYDYTAVILGSSWVF